MRSKKSARPILLAGLVVGALAISAAPEAAAQTAHDSQFPALTREEICALALTVAKQKVVLDRDVSLLDQPCTKELAGFSGKVLTDVVIITEKEKVRGRRPLERGETCGDSEIIVGCDARVGPGICSKDRSTNEHWKLRVALSLEKPDLIRGDAVVLPYKIHHDGAATVPPCGSSRGFYAKDAGSWRAVQAPAPPAAPKAAPSTPGNKH